MTETTPDTHPLAAFREDPADILAQLSATHRSITLTVDGKPAAVLQNPAEYQRLLTLAAQAEEDEAIRQGLHDVEAGRTQPMEEVFEELRARYAIPR